MSYTAEEGVRILGEGKLLVSDSFPGNERNKYCLSSKVLLCMPCCFHYDIVYILSLQFFLRKIRILLPIGIRMQRRMNIPQMLLASWHVLLIPITPTSFLPFSFLMSVPCRD